MKAPTDIYALLSNGKKSQAAHRRAAQEFHAQRLAIACIERARLSSMVKPKPKDKGDPLPA